MVVKQPWSQHGHELAQLCCMYRTWWSFNRMNKFEFFFRLCFGVVLLPILRNLIVLLHANPMLLFSLGIFNHNFAWFSELLFDLTLLFYLPFLCLIVRVNTFVCDYVYVVICSWIAIHTQEYTEEFRDIAKGNKSKEALPAAPITLIHQRPVGEELPVCMPFQFFLLNFFVTNFFMCLRFYA